MTTFNSKTEIISTLQASNQRVTEWFTEIPADIFFARQGEAWDEGELDQYQLPHPILGKLNLREMLYFTIYHNLRHASQEGD